MKSVVTDPNAYDWEGDLPLKGPWSRTIIYEMHAIAADEEPETDSRISDLNVGDVFT